jgi:hypothetical protein
MPASGLQANGFFFTPVFESRVQRRLGGATLAQRRESLCFLLLVAAPRSLRHRNL